MQNFRAYWALVRAAVQARMEYRASFVMFVLTILGFYGAQIAVIGLMLDRFRDIGGWSPGQIAFLYGLLVLSQGIVAACFGGLIEFSDFVRQGTFDRLLLRPLSPLMQALAMRFEPGGIANIALGIAAFVVAQTMVSVEWDLVRASFFILTIIGSSCILASIRVMIAAIAFITVSTDGLQHLFVFSSREFLLYPLDIFSRPVRVLLTFFFPLAFINFYPAHYFLNKESVFLFHPIFVFMTLPVGILMMVLAGMLWKVGVSRYASTGS